MGKNPISLRFSTQELLGLGCGWLWLVVAGFGWLWLVVGRCGWFWLVPRFSMYVCFASLLSINPIQCREEGQLSTRSDNQNAVRFDLCCLSIDIRKGAQLIPKQISNNCFLSTHVATIFIQTYKTTHQNVAYLSGNILRYLSV